VLSNTLDQAEIEAAAQRVSRAFDQPFTVDGEAIEVGASVGLAVWPDDASGVEALMRHADADMYRAKRAAALA
jgi:GGDEF domain-containing protein